MIIEVKKKTVLNLSEFGCDEGLFIKKIDLFFLLLRKGNLLYSINIENCSDIDIEYIKETLLSKMFVLKKYNFEQNI